MLSVTNASGAAITNPNDIANIQPFRYRGYYYDSETGLYYLRSRYYDPVTHRFINADGLVSTGTGVLGYNMFAYCGNNPIVYMDPLGLYNTYTITTYDGKTISQVPEFELWHYGQLQSYELDGGIVPLGKKSGGYTLYVYKDGNEPTNDILSDSKNIIAFDKRYNTDNPDIQIYNSYKYGFLTQDKVVSEIYDYCQRNPSIHEWERKIPSMLNEWAIHSAAYYSFSIIKVLIHSVCTPYCFFDKFLNSKINSAQHVDLDYNDRNKY